MASLCGCVCITNTLEEPWQFLSSNNLDDDRIFHLYCSRLRQVYEKHESFTSAKDAFSQLDAYGLEGVPQRYLDTLAEYMIMYDHKDEIERKKISDLKQLNEEIAKLKKDGFSYSIILLNSKRDQLLDTLDKKFICSSCYKPISKCCESSSSLRFCSERESYNDEERYANQEFISDEFVRMRHRY
jgi:hypothetical protein